MVKEHEIDIRGIDKAKLLKSLWSAGVKNRLFFMNDESCEKMMPLNKAREIIEQRQKTGDLSRFDYVDGVMIKTNLMGDKLDIRLYDRDNGDGALKNAISHLLK